MVGNPPFVGGKKLRREVGDQYVDRMFSVYEDRVPQEADLVGYWFHKAGRLMASGRTARVGLVATNSIRDGSNRRFLESVLQDGQKKRIFDAWSDEPWVVDGAAVRVSLICFSRADEPQVRPRHDGAVMDEAFTDLTGRIGGAGIDLTAARPLAENAKTISSFVPSLRMPSGFLYLAVALDVFSRRGVGWAMHSPLATDLASVCQKTPF